MLSHIIVFVVSFIGGVVCSILVLRNNKKKAARINAVIDTATRE